MYFFYTGVLRLYYDRAVERKARRKSEGRQSKLLGVDLNPGLCNRSYMGIWDMGCMLNPVSYSSARECISLRIHVCVYDMNLQFRYIFIKGQLAICAGPESVLSSLLLLLSRLWTLTVSHKGRIREANPTRTQTHPWTHNWKQVCGNHSLHCKGLK